MEKLGGRYRLCEPLGAGGMSVVWRAEDEVLGREVAVKVLSADLSADPALLGQLLDEARAAAALKHPNVVEVYDYGESYVVMELVAGRSLKALLSAGPLAWPVATLIGAQVAAALEAAHARGVVHRDVKPANVMVTATSVKLVDFGISAAAGDPESLLGTPAYLAPERLAGGVVRPATDVYALGLLLYLMLAGQMPWLASTTTQMLAAHQYWEPAELPDVPGLPAEVAELVARCLDKRPTARPSAGDAARVLASAAGQPLSPTRRAPRRAVRHRAALAAVAFALPATTALAWWQTDTPATATPPISCTVRYQVLDATAGHASTTVTLVNDGTVPVEGWRLSFRLPGDQRLLKGSNARWDQTGELIRADGASLTPGTPVTTTFESSYRNTTVLPDGFTLNAVACRSNLSFQGRSASASASPSPSASPPAAEKPRRAHPPAHAKGPAKRGGPHPPA